MTDRVKEFLNVLKSKEYKNKRRYEAFDSLEKWGHENAFAADTDKFITVLKTEEPYILEWDIFGFRRTLTTEPKGSGMAQPNNVVPDYPGVMSRGLCDILIELKTREKCDFFNSLIIEIEAVLEFCDRYKTYAKENDHNELYAALCNVPRNKPTTFYEACVFMTICIYTLRYNRNNHITLGRFDQYMYPYFKADIDSGVSTDELFEILELFFISLNIDTDLYFGEQQGDNGQSMVLGGYDLDGTDRYNELSELCIKASTELCLIDPKINLRVNKTTPIERYKFATELTKKGLGFPQYCNDDIVVPGLIKLCYKPEDAADYAVAACWEYITSGKGNDWVNIRILNLPFCFLVNMKENYRKYTDYESFFKDTKKGLVNYCINTINETLNRRWGYSVWFSMFVNDCIKRGKDVSEGGAVYNNLGFLSAGISTLADSVAAVKKIVFEEKYCNFETLIKALEADFNGYDELRNKMLNCPKMGNNDDYVDTIACEFMSVLSHTVNGYPNELGGIYRVGTGSAHGYIILSRGCGATPDGRKAFTPYAASFTPSPIAKTKGPLSVIQSFTKYDLTEIINGGPLTMEIHDTVFRNDDGIEKTAMLVKSFIDLGGHQLQLNSINRETLLDAQNNPEDHKNLIVRVWGWSGYFNELDIEYQNHIIARTEYTY